MFVTLLREKVIGDTKLADMPDRDVVATILSRKLVKKNDYNKVEWIDCGRQGTPTFCAQGA